MLELNPVTKTSRTMANVGEARKRAAYAMGFSSSFPLTTHALFGNAEWEPTFSTLDFKGSWFEVIRMAQTLRVIPALLAEILATPAKGNKFLTSLTLKTVEKNALAVFQNDVRVKEHLIVQVTGDIESGGMVIVQGDRAEVHIDGDLAASAAVLVVGDKSKVVVTGDIQQDAVVLAVGSDSEVAVLGTAERRSTVEAHGVHSRVAVTAASPHATIAAVHEMDGVSIGIAH